VITGRGLPPDLEADMQGSRYLRQYSPGGAYWLARPSALRDTNLTEAFEPGPGSVPPPEERPRLTIPPAELGRLSGVLAAHGLNPADVNTSRTVTSALPIAPPAGSGANSVVMMAAPLARPATQDARSLSTSTRDIPVGVMRIGRPLALSDRQIPSLPADIYLVKIRHGQPMFVASNGREYGPGLLQVEMRQMSRNVEQPETLLTAQDMCYSWNHVQVCTEPSLRQAFTTDEQRRIDESGRQAVAMLAQRGILTSVEAANINLEEVIPDAEGKAAVARQQASIIAAPTVDFPAPGQEVAHDALLGIVNAVLDVEVPGFPTLPQGMYAVRAQQRGDTWRGVFVGVDGRRHEIPAQFVEVRGQIERPMAIVINLRIGLCFWEC
jgi:hypothetical protein